MKRAGITSPGACFILDRGIILLEITEIFKKSEMKID